MPPSRVRGRVLYKQTYSSVHGHWAIFFQFFNINNTFYAYFGQNS